MPAEVERIGWASGEECRNGVIGGWVDLEVYKESQDSVKGPPCLCARLVEMIVVWVIASYFAR